MKNLGIILGLMMVCFSVLGQEEALIDSANIYYKNAAYEKAIQAYESVLGNGFESAELYYNLGNSYYKSNKIALAIANYERSLKLNPNDEDVVFNLRMANTYVVDKIDVLPQFFLSSWMQRFIQTFDSYVWAIFSMVAFVIALILLLFFFLSNSIVLRKVSFWIGVFVLFVSIVTFNFSRKQKILAELEPEAIVLTPSVVVKSSPDESGTQLFLIHEGLKVTVVDKLGEWREVKLSDGNVGWLKVSDIIII